MTHNIGDDNKSKKPMNTGVTKLLRGEKHSVLCKQDAICVFVANRCSHGVICVRFHGVYDTKNLTLTPAARMSPNREANAVYNAAVKPSFVSVAKCELRKTDVIAQERGFYTLGTAMSALGVLATSTPSADAVARGIGKRRGKVLNTERVGGRESRRASAKPWKATGATLARSPFFDFGVSASDSRTKNKHAQKRKVVVDDYGTEGRVSGGESRWL